MALFILPILATLLTSCAVVSDAASPPSGDIRHWLTYRVEIGDQVLQFSVPSGVNEDFMDLPVPKRVDLQNSATFDETGSAEILVRHWDYRKNAFSSGEGTLLASIGVGYSERTLDDMPALQEAVREAQEMVRIRAIARDPKYRGPLTPPVRFDPVKIAGKDAWYVSYRILPSSYAVPLDQHHYLSITIYNPVSRSPLREDAQAAADAILKSISIEPKH